MSENFDSQRQHDLLDAASAAELNRDPLTGTPGSHPVGTAVGSAGAAAAGAAVGAVFGGPLGFLVGGTIGAIVGGAAGHAMAERVDPTGELEYWRGEWRSRSYADPALEFEHDYAPAFRFGIEQRNQATDPTPAWSSATESQLEGEWERARGQSALNWSKARAAVHDAWDHADRTARTYAASDNYWRDRVTSAPYYGDGTDYDRDFRMAYRYGTWARSRHYNRVWDARLEQELSHGWSGFRRNSLLEWEQAMPAVRDAFEQAHLLVPDCRAELRAG